MSEQIEELRSQLRGLEDRSLIHDVLYAYGAALDYGDRELFLGCFTSDAEYVVAMRTGGDSGMELHGHVQLGAYFDGHTHAPDAWHKHITTNPAVVIEGDTATATSYFIRVDAAPEAGPATVVASGRYRDQLGREDGRWRIRRRVCEVENL